MNCHFATNDSLPLVKGVKRDGQRVTCAARSSLWFSLPILPLPLVKLRRFGFFFFFFQRVTCAARASLVFSSHFALVKLHRFSVLITVVIEGKYGKKREKE
jgi:hypothetical protein